MNWVQLASVLIPLLEQIIQAIESAYHPGQAVTMPPKMAMMRGMLGNMKTLVDAADDGLGRDRLSALERTVADLHAALSEKAPAAVQRAVADVPPVPAS